MSAPGYLGNYSPPPHGVQLVRLGGYSGLGLSLEPGAGPMVIGGGLPAGVTARTSSGVTKTITGPVASTASTVAAEIYGMRRLSDAFTNYAASLDAARTSPNLNYLEKAAVRAEAVVAHDASARTMAFYAELRSYNGWTARLWQNFERFVATHGGLPSDQDMLFIRKVGGLLLTRANALRIALTTVLGAARARYAVSAPPSGGAIKTNQMLTTKPIVPSNVIGPSLTTKTKSGGDDAAPPPPPPPPPPSYDQTQSENVPFVPEELPPVPDTGQGPEVLTPDYRALFARFASGYPACIGAPDDRPLPPDCGERFNEFLRAEGIAPPPSLPPQTYPEIPQEALPPSDLVFGAKPPWKVADLFRAPDGFGVPPIVLIGGVVVIGYFLFRPKAPKANPHRRRRRRRR